MKIKNVLLPILGTTTLSMGIVPMVSCSNGKHTILLYAEDGKFDNNKHVMTISCGEGIALKNLNGYAEPTLSDMEFVGWTDQYGQYIPEETIITSDMVLKANYALPAQQPRSFTRDSWQTVLNVCDQGYVAFAKAYCGYTGNDEEDAKSAISLWTVYDMLYEGGLFSVRPVHITRGVQTITGYVHIIGFDDDTIYGTDQKAKFTFEFLNVIDLCVYNNDHEFHHWYQLDGKTEKEAFLRKYLNQYVYNYLPIELRKAIKTVDKSTPDLVLDYDTGMILSITNSHSPEKLFPLDMFENNAYIFLNANPYMANQYNALPGNAYSFYNYALAYLAYDPSIAARAWAKSLYDFDNAPMPYWLRTGSISVEPEEGGDPIIAPIAYALYAWSGEVVTCPGSPSDIGFGVSPAFCI